MQEVARTGRLDVEREAQQRAWFARGVRGWSGVGGEGGGRGGNGQGRGEGWGWGGWGWGLGSYRWTRARAL